MTRITIRIDSMKRKIKGMDSLSKIGIHVIQYHWRFIKTACLGEIKNIPFVGAPSLAVVLYEYYREIIFVKTSDCFLTK